MKQNAKYPITNFYIGELYLYKQFGNLLAGNCVKEGQNKINAFNQSGAINFQQDSISKYIDWEERREYTGFLTLFYKQGNQYICLHDGKIYKPNQPNIIDNLVLLSDLLPKIDANRITKISMHDALELFDTLFKTSMDESKLYIDNKRPKSNYFIGDIVLKERTPLEITDARIQYVNLSHHFMLSKSNLEIYSFGRDNYSNTVYRCLFLKDIVDLYNINNHQFYNLNEDTFDSIIPFEDYMKNFKIDIPAKTISIPKALKLFKRTIKS